MASTQSAPSSQKSGDRPISFVLVDNTNPNGSILAANTLTLYVRPEDLTRTDTSRMNVIQTLGGAAWMDNFGPGLPTINISGHTGWRRPTDPAAGTDDGIARFLKLKNQVFTNWHARRQIALQAGKDPDSTVQLQFADMLDSIAAVVAPMSFTLRRSKSRPLLAQYNISMVVLQDNISISSTINKPNPTSPINALNGVSQITAGITSMTNSINSITNSIKSVQAGIDQSIAAPIAAFMRQTSTLFTAVSNAVNSTVGVTNSLLSVARLTAQCGANIFHSIAAIAAIPQIIKGEVMAVGAAFSNIFCVLTRVFSQQLFYPQYSPLYGSSNCSSTNGGLPVSSFVTSGQNPFQSTNPLPTADAVQMTTSAQVAMQSFVQSDNARFPPALGTIGNTAQAAANGLVFA